jgi:hypothetical protein
MRKNAAVMAVGAVVICGVGIAVLLLACYGWLYFVVWAFPRAYHEVKIGQSEAQVRAIFGREPDYSCRYKQCNILYYVRRHLVQHDVFHVHGAPQVRREEGRSVPMKPEDLPHSVNSRDDLPWVYDAAVFVFGPEDALRAFTWLGEEDQTHTVLGDVAGDDFTCMDEAIFEGDDNTLKIGT